MPTLLNKIFVSVFEQTFCPIFPVVFWFSTKILLLKIGRNKNFIIQSGYGDETLSNNISWAYVVNSPWKKRFCDFSPMACFFRFFDTRLLNYSLVQRFVYTFVAVWSKFDSIPHQKCIQIAGPNCSLIV